MLDQSLVLFLIISLIQTVAAKNSQGGRSLCQRYGQASTVIGTKIYYDGGWWSTTATKGTGDAQRANKTLLLDVSKSFTLDQLTLEELDITVPDDHWTENGVLFADNSTLYLYGAYEGGSSLYPEWTVDVNGGKAWEHTTVKESSFQTTGGKIEVTNSNTGYAQGGDFGYTVGGANNGSVKASSSVLQYDLGSRKVSNISAAYAEVAQNSLAWVGVGKQGLLVSFGGVDASSKNIDPATVYVFDIDGGKWYSQNTTGSVPENLVGGSAVVASAPDGSSHNIYVFGDYGMYILSLPTFTWVPALGPESNRPWARQRPSMDVVGQRQILLYGGEDGADCDKTPAYLYDMSVVSWNDTFDPNARAYEVPELLTKTIGGTAGGGAAMTAPKSGWGSNAALGSIFTATYTPTTSSPSSTSSASANPATSTAVQNNPKDTPVIPMGVFIAITVLASLLFTAMLVAAFLFCTRRERLPKRSESRQGMLEEQWGKAELPWEEAPTRQPPVGELPAYEEVQRPVPARARTIKRVTEDVLELLGDTQWRQAKRKSVMSVFSRRSRSSSVTSSTSNSTRRQMRPLSPDAPPVPVVEKHLWAKPQKLEPLSKKREELLNQAV